MSWSSLKWIRTVACETLFFASQKKINTGLTHAFFSSSHFFAEIEGSIEFLPTCLILSQTDSCTSKIIVLLQRSTCEGIGRVGKISIDPSIQQVPHDSTR